MKRLVFVAGLVLSLSFLKISLPANTHASEGIFELKNQTGEDARCYALSVLMGDLSYKILASCRDILYPGGTEVFSYVAWINPADGGNPQRLGTLGVGKVEFKTKTAFTSIFVTKELNSNARQPGGTIVMQGGLQRITLLENPDLAEIETPELGEPEASPSPSPKASSRINIFRIGGAAAFVGIFLIILLVLFLTRR